MVQSSQGHRDYMSTDVGTPISDTDNWLRAGARGPALLQDFHGREKVSQCTFIDCSYLNDSSMLADSDALSSLFISLNI